MQVCLGPGWGLALWAREKHSTSHDNDKTESSSLLEAPEFSRHWRATSSEQAHRGAEFPIINPRPGINWAYIKHACGSGMPFTPFPGKSARFPITDEFSGPRRSVKSRDFRKRQRSGGRSTTTPRIPTPPARPKDPGLNPVYEHVHPAQYGCSAALRPGLLEGASSS